MARRAILLGICGLFACAYAAYGLFRHWHFGSSAYDLGIFDQAVWHLSRLEAPASTISGFPNILGDHFYPVIALFAPLYWFAPRPETLIVAQAVLFAASIVPVSLYLRDRLTPAVAWSLTVAYGLFWGLQRAAAFDVHEMAFAPLLVATAILAMDGRREGKAWATHASPLLFWGSIAALIFVKEDLIPLLAGFGLYLIVQRDVRRGASLLVASVVIFLLVIGLVVPAFNDAGTFAYMPGYGDLLWQPWRLPAMLVTPTTKIATALLWLAPFLFVSLASPVLLIMVPVAIERLLSPFPQHWGTAFHYSAPLAPIIAMSAGDGLARLARSGLLSAVALAKADSRTLIGAVAAASIVLSAVLPGNQPLWRLFTGGHYRTTEVHRAGYEALALVPADASVVAQAAVVPHLSAREQIFILDAGAPEADYVLAAAALSPWPASRFEELEMVLADRQQRGYTVVFERDGWIVLRRT